MKIRAVLVGLFPGLIAAALLAAIPARTVSAQICFDAQHPNGYPCPEKKKKPTVVYPSFTPTATSTPTPTQTPTSTPSPTPTPTSTPSPPLWTFASGPADGPGGFTCPPYVGSIPLGAGIAAVGLLMLAARARIRRSKAIPSGYVHDDDEAARRIDEMKAAVETRPTSFARDMIAAVVLVIVALLVNIFSSGRNLLNLFTGVGKSSANGGGAAGPGQDGTGLLWALMLGYQRLRGREARSDRKTARSDREIEISEREEHLRSENASIEAGMAEAEEKADHSMAAATSGMISGIIGGLIGMASQVARNQGSVPPAPALVGAAVTGAGTGILGSALLGGFLGLNCISTYLVLPGGALLGTIFALGVAVLSQTGSQGYPLLDPMGPVSEDGSRTGSAGLHKDKDLE